MTEIAQRLSRVTARIAAAAAAAGRSASDVTLVAVSKTHAPARVVEAAAAGALDLGENRVSELVAKRPIVEAAVQAPVVRWHLIGQLQRRQAPGVVGVDVLLHGVDRVSLVDRLERLAAEREVVQRILVQVNVGDDPAKGGCSLTEVDRLVAYAQSRPHIAVEGLMTIPPLPPIGTDANDAARPLFETLRATADRLQLACTSMGMSADLEAAVAAGATHVRVGTDIFGARGSGPWSPTSSTTPPSDGDRSTR
jgi:pyridoxal phosphate enzyme (YggS family)